MKINVEVNKADYAKVKKALKKLANSAGLPFYKTVGRRLQNNFLLGFRKSQAPDGTPWAPITYRPGQPLLLTGRLRRSITFRAKDDQVEVGTNTAYAKAMHYGLDNIKVPAHTKLINQAFGKQLKYPVYAKVKAHNKKVNVKPRPFLGIEKPQKRIIVSIYTKFVNDIAKGGTQ